VRPIAKCEMTNPSDEVSSARGSSIGRPKVWAVNGANFYPCEQTSTKLPPGQYTINHDNRGFHFTQRDTKFDAFIRLPDSASDEIIAHIREFWSKEELFRKHGYLWKRGVLLWGPQGSGKTTIVQIVANEIVETGGIAVYCEHPTATAQGLAILRRIEPTRPVVVIIEDIDAVTNDYGESSLLALLDGELQVDNIVFVATTNYPKQLDKRLINRPSRFDIVRKIGMPNASAREAYLVAKNPRLGTPDAATELQVWIKGSDKFSIAHLRELIISVEVLGQDYKYAIERLTKMNTQLPDETELTGFGFTKS